MTQIPIFQSEDRSDTNSYIVGVSDTNSLILKKLKTEKGSMTLITSSCVVALKSDGSILRV